MDPSQGLTSTMNTNVFKEPRGVMRVLQFVFSICAFATTTGFTNYVKVFYKCGETPADPITLHFSYPFRLDYVTADMKCEGNNTTLTTSPYFLYGNFSSDAQFFVAAGVMAFLYCILISVVYLLFDAIYQSNDRVPQIDFIITVILAMFWLSGSAAWAVRLGAMKTTTSSEILSKLVGCTHSHITCTSFAVGSYSGLDISIILGFLNFFLWASDLWFLYKETTWFKVRQTTSNMAAAT